MEYRIEYRKATLQGNSRIECFGFIFPRHQRFPRKALKSFLSKMNTMVSNSKFTSSHSYTQLLFLVNNYITQSYRVAPENFQHTVDEH